MTDNICIHCGDKVEEGLEGEMAVCAYCTYLEFGYFPTGYGMSDEEIEAERENPGKR